MVISFNPEETIFQFCTKKEGTIFTLYMQIGTKFCITFTQKAQNKQEWVITVIDIATADREKPDISFEATFNS